MAEREAIGPAMRRPTVPRTVWRALLVAGPVLAFAITLAGPASHLASLVGADDWGSDWWWLEDGLRRLAAGESLVRPEYVAAPFSQFPAGPAYTWSLHPPYTASLIGPMLLLPEGLRTAAWTWLMAIALGLAIWLAWPRRLWWGTQLLVAAVLLGPPFVGVSLGLVDQVHFANPNALVVLGVVIAWIGRRHGSAGLVAGGLALAALKIVPAIGLGAWLLAQRDRRPGLDPGPAGSGGEPQATADGLGDTRRREEERRAGSRIAVPAILSAAAMLVALTVPVLVIDPGVLADTAMAQGNLVPLPGDSNLAPSVRLAPIIGGPAALWLSRLAVVATLALVVVRRLDGPGGFLISAAAPLLLTPQLWAHWLLIPAVAALAVAGSWGPLRAADRRLRLAWLGTGRGPVDGRRSDGRVQRDA